MVNFPKAETSQTMAIVVGQPINHSLSPLIHNTAFTIANLKWTYHAVDVPKEKAQECIEAIRDNNIRGVSVTMPLKEAVIPFLDELSETAKELKAVNCISWDGEKLVGHNTDGDGFVNSLVAETGEGISGSSFAIVGAGGAARAVIRSLREASVAKITVVNRTHDKAIVAAQLGGVNASVGTTELIPECDYVVNATSIGMAGTENEGSMPFPARYLKSSHTVVDLVYNPIETPLLLAARKAGATGITGVGMLVHQAALQYQLWTGMGAPIQEIERKITSEITQIAQINE